MGLVRIRYKGLSDVRVIKAKDLEPYGVSVPQDLVWDNVGAAVGGQVIPDVERPNLPNSARGLVIDGLSDDLLAVLKREGTFTITEVTDEGRDGEEIITGQPLDDTGMAIRDLTSGQATSGEPNADADPAGAGVGEAQATDSGEAALPSDTAGTAEPKGRTGRGSST